jgi:hypothetical protein
MTRTPSARLLAQRENDAVVLVAAMWNTDLVLHRTFTKSGDRWALSNSARVEREVAKAAIEHPDVVPVGGTLFEGGPSQTYRHVSK